MTLFSQKQGKNVRDQKETTVLRVKDLREYIEKIANSKKDTLEDLNNGDDIDICLDLDAGGGRVVAEFGILSEKSETLKIHPILIYQGTDVRQNLEICLGGLTEQIRNLEKSIVKINGKSLKIKLYGLFDLCALNTVVGKQNHSSTYFCAWTSCKLEHIRNHKNVAHTESTCKEIVFLTIEDYVKNITHHSIGALPDKASGKLFGSTVAENIIPLADIFRYIVPLMHCIMGCANQVYNELNRYVKELDEKENRLENQEYRENIKVNLGEKKVEKKEKEVLHGNANLARMVAINALERIPALMVGDVKAAERISKQNYNNKTSRRKREQCDAEMCIIFPIDIDNNWDERFECLNGCEIHLLCEGLVPKDENEEMPDRYTCMSCEQESGNKSWLKEKLETAKSELTVKIGRYEREIQELSMSIEKLDIEDSKSGPRQKILKECAKALNINPAKYHGGDLEGKASQELLGCAKNKSFSILKCIKDKPIERAKFERALTNLYQINEILKNKDIDYFDDEDVENVRLVCEKWGIDFPFDFPHLNLTPKGHILSFVLPKIIEKTRTFRRFYAMEEKGEQIHAVLNDIERKIW